MLNKNKEKLYANILEVSPQILSRLSKKMFRETDDGKYITYQQFRVMHAVHNGRIFPGEIAKRMSVSQAVISRLINSLKNRDLILLTLDDLDRRRTKISLTSKGDDLLTQLTDIALEEISELTADIPDDEMQILADAFLILRDRFRLIAGKDA